MPQTFPHENLEVYSHALSFAKLGAALIDSWRAVFAVCDQLDRATESIVTNLAKAARLQATPSRIHCLECSLGSVLECAACLDVAYRRHLVAAEQLHEAKKVLQRIARMEVKLRQSWGSCLQEETEPYGSDAKPYFLHESLVVYQRSLQVHEALDSLWEPDKMGTVHQENRRTVNESDDQHRRRERSFLEAGSQQVRVDCGGRRHEAGCLLGFGGGVDETGRC